MATATRTTTFNYQTRTFHYQTWIKSAPTIKHVPFRPVQMLESRSMDSLIGRASLICPESLTPQTPQMSVLDLVHSYHESGNLERMVNLLRIEIPLETNPENLRKLYFYFVNYLVQKELSPIVIATFCKEALKKCGDTAIENANIKFFYASLFSNLLSLKRYDSVIETCLELISKVPQIPVPLFFCDALIASFFAINSHNCSFDTIVHVFLYYFSELDDSQKNWYFLNLKVAMTGILETTPDSSDNLSILIVKLDMLRYIAQLLNKAPECTKYLTERAAISEFRSYVP